MMAGAFDNASESTRARLAAEELSEWRGLSWHCICGMTGKGEKAGPGHAACESIANRTARVQSAALSATGYAQGEHGAQHVGYVSLHDHRQMAPSPTRIFTREQIRALLDVIESTRRLVPEVDPIDLLRRTIG